MMLYPNILVPLLFLSLSGAIKDDTNRYAHKGTFAITNVRVFDGHDMLSGLKTVVIEDGLIRDTKASGDSNSEQNTIDGQGGTLLPGLIDSHVHMDPPSARHLVGMRRQGVTTALDCGCFLGANHTACDAMNLARQPSGVAHWHGARTAALAGPYPELFFSYLPAVGAGSHISRRIGPRRSIAGKDDAEAWLLARAEEPSSFVKLVLTAPAEPGLDPPTAWLLVSGAHAAGKKVVCHATDGESIAAGLDAGCDQLHHVATSTERPMDDALVERVREAGVPVAPTLVQMQGVAHEIARSWLVWVDVMWHRLAHGIGAPTPSYETAASSARRLYEAGVPILVGTDATGDNLPVVGTVGFDDGFSREVDLLAAAGVRAVDILRGATGLPARHFGLADRGAIAPGKRADLLLVPGNPAENISTLHDVRRVWIGGFEADNRPDKEAKETVKDEL